jgi:hypothetical protein
LIEAFHLVRHNRVLWVLGLGMSLLQGLATVQTTFIDQSRTDAGALLCFLVVLQIVGVFVSLGFLGGLIYAANGSGSGNPPRFREAWVVGRERIWPLFVLSLLLGLLAAVPGLLLYLLFGASGLTIILASALLLPVVYLAQCAMVLYDRSTGAALATGWRLMRANLLGVLVISVAVTAGQQLADALSGLLTGPLVGSTIDTAADAGTRLGIGVVVWLISSLLGALPATWGIVSWTVFYRTATGGRVTGSPAFLDTGLSLPPQETPAEG